MILVYYFYTFSCYYLSLAYYLLDDFLTYSIIKERAYLMTSLNGYVFSLLGSDRSCLYNVLLRHPWNILINGFTNTDGFTL